MLRMLHPLIGAGTERPIWWLHGARDGARHALADEVAALAVRHPKVGAANFGRSNKAFSTVSQSTSYSSMQILDCNPA